MEKRITNPKTLDELRKAVTIGIEQAKRGELVPFDVEAMKAKCRILLKAKRAKDQS